MNYQKKTVRDIDVKGKKVLLRCDFNVPQDKKTGAITSDKRIVAALPTIRYLLDQGAAVIACSHLGKPQPDFDKWVKKQTEKGKDPAELTEAAWSKEQKKLTLAPVAARLAELLGQEVIFATYGALTIPVTNGDGTIAKCNVGDARGSHNATATYKGDGTPTVSEIKECVSWGSFPLRGVTSGLEVLADGR